MKLGSLKSGGRDGTLVVVSRDLAQYVVAADVAPSLREAVENWGDVSAKLKALSDKLNDGLIEGVTFDSTQMAAPLPRSFQWVDGSAYLSHMRLVRAARGAEMPENAETDPLMYQGSGDPFLGPCDDIPLADPNWGLDFESELAVITADAPIGVQADDAQDSVLLYCLCNDVSLRNLIPAELSKGFGFVQSKAPSAFAPVCVTADEFGAAWDGRKVHRPVVTTYNGQVFGEVEAGNDLAFDFGDLIAHLARTRPVSAGTIVGSGTIANDDYATVGSSCLAERRMIEVLENGAPVTPFMKAGDSVRIEMFGEDGQSIFGAIDQVVVSA